MYNAFHHPHPVRAHEHAHAHSFAKVLFATRRAMRKENASHRNAESLRRLLRAVAGLGTKQKQDTYITHILYMCTVCSAYKSTHTRSYHGNFIASMPHNIIHNNPVDDVYSKRTHARKMRPMREATNNQQKKRLVIVGTVGLTCRNPSLVVSLSPPPLHVRTDRHGQRTARRRRWWGISTVRTTARILVQCRAITIPSHCH